MKIQKRIISLLLVIGMFLTLLTGCGGSGQTAENEADTFLGNGRSVLRIVSGSENAELEPILTKFARAGECADRDDVSGLPGYYAPAGGGGNTV